MDLTHSSKMHGFADFPPEILDGILGSNDVSYVVIKLWLCGSLKLNEKLSRGLTFLQLDAHELSSCKLPRLVFELRSLRYLDVFSRTHLIGNAPKWSEAMKSLPNTLTSLTIICPDAANCLTDYGALSPVEEIDLGDANWTHPQPSSPPLLDFEPLFPRLQLLSIRVFAVGDPPIPSDWLSKLPSSLTHLNAPLTMIYNDPNSQSSSGPLSLLPRGLLKLEGSFKWKIQDKWRDDMPTALVALREDFANAPPSLQYISTDSLCIQSTMTDYWLPSSLREVNLSQSCFQWSLQLSKSLPSSIDSLTLGKIDAQSFEGGNWVSRLPMSLTSLILDPTGSIDLLSFIHCLPPKLASLTVESKAKKQIGALGDWSQLPTRAESKSNWPSTLTALKLPNFMLLVLDLVRLPSTIKTLSVTVGTHGGATEIEVIDPKYLPPGLTDLTMAWLRMARLALSDMKQLKYLRTCNFSKRLDYLKGSIDFPNAWNDSVERLVLPCLTIKDSPTWALPSRLTDLTTGNWNVDWFKHLPQSLKRFDTSKLEFMADSHLVAHKRFFEDVPKHITYLSLGGPGQDEKYELPPQPLAHLTSLHSLLFTCSRVSSGMLRMLPASVRSVYFISSKWLDCDLPFAPPRHYVVDACFNGNAMEFLHRMRLADLLHKDCAPIEARLRQFIANEAKHQ